MSNGSTKGGLLAKLSRYITAVQQFLPSTFQVGIQSVDYDTASLVAKLQELLKPAQDAATADQAAKAARGLIKTQKATTDAFLKAFVAAIRAYLGNDNPKLINFGINPSKPTVPLTTTEKLQRSLKAKATRKARGTLGSRQKQAIKATSVPAMTIDSSGLHPAGQSASTTSTSASEPASAVSPAAGSSNGATSSSSSSAVPAGASATVAAQPASAAASS